MAGAGEVCASVGTEINKRSENQHEVRLIARAAVTLISKLWVELISILHQLRAISGIEQLR